MNGKVEKCLKKRAQQSILKELDLAYHPILMERGIMSKESKGKLLIIEGEGMGQGAVGELLAAAGYEAVLVEDPESAKSLARQSEPDVLLMNVGSPEKKWVKKLTKMKAPVVVLTDASGVDQWDEEMGDGVYE
jgi:DNA-binding NtrC family response regulator